MKPNYPPRSGWAPGRLPGVLKGRHKPFFFFFFNIFIKIKIKIVIQRQTKGCKQGKGQKGGKERKGHGGGGAG